MTTKARKVTRATKPAARPKAVEVVAKVSKKVKPRAKPPAVAARRKPEAGKFTRKAATKTVLVQKSGAATKILPKPKSKKPAGKKVQAMVSTIILPADYRPTEAEPFMSERQRLYFRTKLVSWRDDILRQTRETLQVLTEDSSQHADLADRATSETDRALELRARDRQRKLVAKIDSAIGRIEDGTYGYCEETGEPISLKRLDARPIATLSLEAQERHERRERVFRED